MPLSNAALRAVMRQVQDLVTAPLDGIRVLEPEDASHVEAVLDGPADTPFAGGAFHIVLVFEEDYPAVPPKAFFKTKIFHPNIAEGKGDVCVNTLKKDWEPTYGLRHVLQVIRCLLVEPNPESALNEEAGRLLLEDYDGYRQQAAMMTKVHGKAAKALSSSNVCDQQPSVQQHAPSSLDTECSTTVSASTGASSGGLRDLGSTNRTNTATASAAKAAEKKKSSLRRV